MIWGQIKNFRKYMTVGGEISWAIMKKFPRLQGLGP